MCIVLFGSYGAALLWSGLFLFHGHMNLIDFIILSLATWRIANMIVDDSEDGPWDILHKVRYLIGIRYKDNLPVFYLEEGTRLNWLEDIHYQIFLAFTCIWCATVWIGILTLLLWFIPYNIGLYLLTPFAISAGALIIKGIVKK